ncbi:DUF1223 domain-containing protein [Parasulfitobacter algicola]|uniref:DUF1223 domain-containing protein n=1 Tax=Parasulfitobacter algicola TaxID=2614809 RepID=A0ABX2IY23_9RHOB|nr:DUF1223 domain-containing protein [Sulfitobacter algicola]NSX55464.1 DUF1223 domain-containing protein [Sulfitobacter algicola]
MLRIIMSALFGLSSLCTITNADTTPVVVELYTSQGCSSCPPADKLLHELAARENVIALALHVDYWDYIGWKDRFADPMHTKRQKAYAHAAGSRTVYTPQMIIGGVDHVVGTRPMQVADMLQKHAAQNLPVQISLTRRGNIVRIEALSSVANPMIVQLVRYSPLETVEIKRGENAGRTLSYANVVTSWEKIDNWSGQEPFRKSIEAHGSSPVVVIIQKDGHGAIYGAAQLK